jgi:DNA segregation ATPase FtsK/SpoIIIE-like protein
MKADAISSSLLSQHSTLIQRRALLLTTLAAPVALSASVLAADRDDLDDFDSCSYAVIEDDALYPLAVYSVSHQRRASTTWLLRQQLGRFCGGIVGYNLCASMLEGMEQEGIVGPVEADNRRPVLIEPLGPPRRSPS